MSVVLALYFSLVWCPLIGNEISDKSVPVYPSVTSQMLSSSKVSGSSVRTGPSEEPH